MMKYLLKKVELQEVTLIRREGMGAISSYQICNSIIVTYLQSMYLYF